MVTETNRTFDLLDGGWYASRPYADWAWMREHAPAYWDATNEVWALTRYDDVLAAEIFLNRLRLRRRLDDDERFLRFLRALDGFFFFGLSGPPLLFVVPFHSMLVFFRQLLVEHTNECNSTE